MSRLLSWRSLIAAALWPLALIAAAQTDSQPDWPKFRGPGGDGISHDAGLLQDWPKEGPPLL